MGSQSAVYEEDMRWAQPKELDQCDVVDIAIDSSDRIYVLTRSSRRDVDLNELIGNRGRVTVYDRDGNFIKQWGKGVVDDFCHGICVGPDLNVYIVHARENYVRKYTNDGEVLQTVGTPGTAYASATGITWSLGINYHRTNDPTLGHPDFYTTLQPSGPFNGPTQIAIAPNGHIYVSDGYANARIHHYSPEFELIRSWGEAGIGPGKFCNPHDLHITKDGLIYVCSLESESVQVFDLDGKFIREHQIQRPSAVAVDREGRICISSHYVGAYGTALRRPPKQEIASRLTVLDANGKILSRIGKDGERFSPGRFTAIDGLAVDSEGSIYLAEMPYTTFGGDFALPDRYSHAELGPISEERQAQRRTSLGAVPPGARTIHKYRKVS